MSSSRRPENWKCDIEKALSSDFQSGIRIRNAEIRTTLKIEAVTVEGNFTTAQIEVQIFPRGDGLDWDVVFLSFYHSYALFAYM